ncbi:MAG: hypothetical protein GKR94_07725 [Gammaproteobacteria bacterium]|nr:hypothetical protein [Gammaproteobacteria bacterium]
MREAGQLSPEVLHRIRRFFRLKSIYHSNAIEGNILDVGETRQVVELGLTLTGKPLKDQAEARNLSAALDLLEDLASDGVRAITEADIRELHHLVLKGVDDENAGAYRTVTVEISGSDYRPPGPESVFAQMSEFAEWLKSASVVPELTSFTTAAGLLNAAVAHTWFVTIHPFIDGNGRVARLLMNLILMRYGYPIAIVSKEDRLRYYDALEASQSSDPTPFMELLSECIDESLEEYERAAEEQRERNEWAQSLAQKFTQPERNKARNEYEVWRNAMELLKSHLRQTAGALHEAADFGDVYFKDFGNLEFEKYSALKLGESAKRAWFFRIDFRNGDKTARYLMFFGYAHSKLHGRCDVTLHVAREDPPNSYHYERLDTITAPNVPDLVEIGYSMSEERFMVRGKSNNIDSGRVEEFGRRFFEDVVSKHFSA